MKIFLRKDIEKIGMQGEIIKVSDGFGNNFLLPQNLGIRITSANESFYKKNSKLVENRKEVLESTTSLLAEKIKGLKLTLKKKMHDGEKLYGSIGQNEIVALLAKEGIKVSKSQVKFDKSIKTKGLFDVKIKLSTRLQPSLKVKISAENS